MRYKVEHEVVRDIIDGRPVKKERYNIYRKVLFGWRKIDYKPSFSLAKQLLRNLGVRKFEFVERV